MKRSVCAHLSAALLLVAVLFTPLKSRACGVNAHLWITDSAICQLPEGSLLRAFYTDQRHVDLTRLGSSFPDSGYAVSHAYGEVAHWPPFVQKYIEDFQSRFGVDDEAWSDEARAEVAFILGVAAHGFEDELFDAQFLRWVSQEDGSGQDIIDPALDFLLIYEGHTELYPPEDFPAAGVTSALQRAGVEVDQDEVELGVARVRRVALHLTQSPETLGGLVERDAPLIPWATRHYLNRDVKGSLAHEPRAVAALLWATYQRLRGEPVAPLALSWVDPSGDLSLDRAGVEAQDESRWISLYFAVAADTESVLSALSLHDARGEPVGFEWRGARWGGGEGFTHLFEVAPRDLEGVESPLTLTLAAGVSLIHGESTIEAQTLSVPLCPTARCERPSSPELRVGGRSRGCWVTDEPESEDELVDGGLASTPLDMNVSRDGETVLDPDQDTGDADPDVSGSDDMSGEVDSDVNDEGEDQRRAERSHSADSGCEQGSISARQSASRLSLLWLIALSAYLLIRTRVPTSTEAST